MSLPGGAQKKTLLQYSEALGHFLFQTRRHSSTSVHIYILEAINVISFHFKHLCNQHLKPRGAPGALAASHSVL